MPLKPRQRGGEYSAKGFAPVALRASYGPSRACQYNRSNKREAILRPHLHPDMGEVVINARVALQVTARIYRRENPGGPTAAYCAAMAARELPPEDMSMLRFALHSLSVYLDQGYISSVWLSNVLEASHFGSSFRRCFFFDYKENRRPYPRVTNRGVQTYPKRRIEIGLGIRSDD